MKSVNSEMESIGFLVGIPYTLFVREIGRKTMLVVEGEPVHAVRGGFHKTSGSYLYTFYKARYERKDGRMAGLKVYMKNRSFVEVFYRVKKYLEFLEHEKVKVR
ncbi:hypothetical protein MFLO_04315 [Listeria floridensis FSL S10-1187]|uniref:Uncharacterized protein n=1 Tax=Listeria floridensis FSL S10-1187 TaxID=1265817 RepID=A0ABP3B2C8_9LIST|nr:hypothetical protein [Listeria floridensis]EUJ33136.1 hypothetical protein MFLO_04315 [Listeria floridensis FSL S10-1187]